MPGGDLDFAASFLSQERVTSRAGSGSEVRSPVMMIFRGMRGARPAVVMTQVIWLSDSLHLSLRRTNTRFDIRECLLRGTVDGAGW